MTVSTGSVLDLKEISGVNWGDQSVHGNHGVLDDAGMGRTLANNLPVVECDDLYNAQVANSEVLERLPLGPFTLMTWVKVYEFTKYDGVMAKSKSALFADGSYGIVIPYMDPASSDISGFFALNIGDDTVAQTLNSARYAAKVWHLVTGTVDGTTISIYVNGDAPATAAQTVTPYTVTNPLLLGKYSSASTRCPCQLYQPRIFTRILVQPEIAAIYEEEEPWFR